MENNTPRQDTSIISIDSEFYDPIDNVCVFLGEQLINRIPNCNLLTNKMGLLNSLQTYARVLNGTRNTENKLKLENFVPETYRLDDRKERQAFFETYKGNYIRHNIYLATLNNHSDHLSDSTVSSTVKTSGSTL